MAMELLKQLEVKNLVKKYTTNNVLENIDFFVEKGEFLTILGPSGCGKTTLLKILIGLEDATAGEVLLEGKSILHMPTKNRKMGIVFQNYALFANMTAYENICYAMKFNPYLKDQRFKIADDLIELLKIKEVKDQYPKYLSGGQQQRVAIARTLALNPAIILFDEPLSALDVNTRNNLRKIIKDIQQKYQTTMIYITHDQEEALTMADRVMIMNEGKIQQIDTPKNIFLNPANEFVKSFVLANIQLKIDALKPFTTGESDE